MGGRLAQVQTIQVGALTGEAGFGHKLIDGLQRLGRFELTDDPALADAVLDADGDDQEQGFVGTVTLRDPRGGVLWTAQEMRPHGAPGPMAYERLLADLVAALGAPEQTRSV